MWRDERGGDGAAASEAEQRVLGGGKGKGAVQQRQRVFVVVGFLGFFSIQVETFLCFFLSLFPSDLFSLCKRSSNLSSCYLVISVSMPGKEEEERNMTKKGGKRRNWKKRLKKKKFF
jgi:hypothetical protein